MFEFAGHQMWYLPAQRNERIQRKRQINEKTKPIISTGYKCYSPFPVVYFGQEPAIAWRLVLTICSVLCESMSVRGSLVMLGTNQL